MNDYNEYLEEQAKKDETYKLYPSYSCFYKFYSWLIYLIYFFIVFAMIITNFEELAIALCIPILFFFIALNIYLKYTHYKEIIVAYNIYYRRVKIYVVNKYNSTRKVLDISKDSAAFALVQEGDIWSYYFTLHIFDNFDKNTSIDIRKMNMEGIPPKFHWSFKNIFCFHHYDEESLLEKYIGEKMIEDYNIKFTSEKDKKKIKYFKTNNFLSFNLHSKIKCYSISIVILIAIIIYAIGIPIFSTYDTYDVEKKNYENQEQQYEEAPLFLILLLGLTWIVSVIIIILLCYIFKYIFYKRIDILKRDNILFIGITSFFKKSYIKKYIFDYISIENFELEKKNCNNATLILNLKDKTNHKICDFTGEKKEDLDFIIKNLNRI